MTARKQIVRTLDAAAARADLNGRGASSKQTWFLAGLIEAHGFDGEFDGTDSLTMKDASFFIDMLLRRQQIAA